MEASSRILITGVKGMAGNALYKLLSERYSNVIGIDKPDYNLLSQEETKAMYRELRPEYVFHLAAKVGGIHANNSQSADFIYENLMIQNNVINHAYIFNVKKLLFCGSACIYPKNAVNPINEDSLLKSELEETNKAYAIAKIAGVTMCEMYRKQYDCDFISAMPTNLYGEGDNFNLNDSHVMPALIRKIHEAKINNSDVEIWGSGNPKREFLYIGDLAEALLFLMNNYSSEKLINIGTGSDIYISDLVNYICMVVGFKGKVIYNADYPDGVYERRLDVNKINNLGWKAKTELIEGINKTYNWFKLNYDRIRK